MTKAFQLTRAILVCVGLLSGAIATAELGKSIELSSVSVLADRLRKDQDIKISVLKSVASGIGRNGPMSCRSDSLYDILTVHLRYLDRLDQAENYDEWAQGMEQASEFVKDAINCSPADGNLWLRLAMLRQATVSIPAETGDLLKRSVKLSPAQINVIFARLEVWRILDDGELAMMSKVAKSDLGNVFAFASMSDLTYLESRLSQRLLLMSRLIIKDLPIKRRKILVRDSEKF